MQKGARAGANTEILAEETYRHINSAFCDGMATTVTAVYHFIWKYLYASMQAALTPASISLSKLRFVTPDKESRMNTLWQGEEFEQICSRQLLTEKAAEIEKTISVKEQALKENAMIWTRQCLWNLKSILESEPGWHSD